MSTLYAVMLGAAIPVASALVVWLLVELIPALRRRRATRQVRFLPMRPTQARVTEAAAVLLATGFVRFRLPGLRVVYIRTNVPSRTPEGSRVVAAIHAATQNGEPQR